MGVPISQFAFWPGAGAIESASYSCSHGITPGQIQFTTIPSPTGTAPNGIGNLVIADGYQNLTVKTCKISLLFAETSRRGTSFIVQAEDRRWRWRSVYGGYGAISGRYNRLDDRGKLVPWSIRSPIELARACFEALGETRYVINLPRGLAKADGANIDRFLRLGENFAQTTANPSFVWDYTPPAEALAQLCDIFGCRIVYQPFQDRFAIIPQGTGLRSFSGAIPQDSAAASFSVPAIPTKIVIVGAPIVWQFRVPLQAVGPEWDGTWIALDQLSFAPKAGVATPQVITITWSPGAGGTQAAVYAKLSWTDSSNEANTGEQSYEIPSGPAVIRTLAHAIAADGNVANNWTVATDGITVTLTAKSTTITGTVIATELDNTGQPAKQNRYIVKSVNGFIGGRSWRSCPPPQFSQVQPTDRLSYTEAQAYARRGVLKAFRILNADPNDPTKPLIIPKFGTNGKLARVQQLIPQSQKVEQVIPMPRIPDGNNRGNPLINLQQGVGGVLGGLGVASQVPLVGGVLPEFYNGISRNQRATVRGSVNKRLPGLSVQYYMSATDDLAKAMNTLENQRVWIDFQITTEEDGTQLVLFNDYVYTWEPESNNRAYLGYPSLVLETGFMITDPDTDMPIRYEYSIPVPGGTAPPEYHMHEDVQIGFVVTYQDAQPDGTKSNIQKGCDYAPGDKADAEGRAKWYASFHLKRYTNLTGQKIDAIGILPIDPDGAVQQIVWSAGSGASTAASINHEFSPVIPSYPARRRAESLPPDASAALANASEREFVDRLFPKSGTTVR